MALINEPLERVGVAAAGRGGKEVGHVVSERRVVGVLLHKRTGMRPSVTSQHHGDLIELKRLCSCGGF